MELCLQKMTTNVTTELEKNLGRLSSEIVCLENKIHELKLSVGDDANNSVVVGSTGRKYADVVKSSSCTINELQKSQLQKDMVINEKVSRSSTSKEEWSLVDNLRRRKLKPIVGVKKDSESCLKGVESRRKSTWDIYVGNLEESVSESQIVDFLKDQSVVVEKCLLLPSKIRGTKCARITVPLEHRDTVLVPEFWPEFVRVRSWVIRPHSSLKFSNQSHSALSVNDGST